MKKQETGLGKYIYMEWLFPVKDYYCSIRKNEVFFEIIFPLLCALGCTYSYFRLGKVHNALDGLSGLLPTAISILIGFTVMLITLLLTSNGENINKLKAKELSKIIYVFLTIFLYLPKCPQSLILSALRAFCFCGKPRISRSIFLYFLYQSLLKSW